MDSNSLCNSLLKWLETFPGREGTTVAHLTDGVVMATVLHQIDPDYFSQFWLVKIKEDVGDNWRLKASNLRKVLQGIVDYFQEQLNQNIKHFPLPDLNKIGEHGDREELGRMLQLILGCAVNCETKQQYIEAIMNMEERVQKVIMEAIQELMLRESSPGVGGADGEARLELGPASFHPHIKTVLEQLETATRARDELVQRCHELEQQVSVLGEEKTNLSSENEKLLSRLDALETGGDLGTSTLRYKDLKKQIDGLQDELYKLETSRDEYRSKAEVLEREVQDVTARNEELQQLADEARSLKDEVDGLREMSERAVVYEGTMETYKKKLEELSDLKRQVRILEEKNSDYLQQNMELEEEVKKSGTWRPQLELYKKQVADLHQRLADEAKKTDRQTFENKKLNEKMEALLQERDRLIMERDQLKESVEELRCHISSLASPDISSRPPSDLSDVELLEVIPHDIRQRLIRLQHENSMLKQRVGGESSEQLPVLQTMVSDLQDRQNSLTQENRWESDVSSHHLHGTGSRTGSRTGSSSPAHSSTFSLLDAYFSVSPSKKMKVFKQNLKWASESDLLILRQPKSLFSTSILSSLSPLKHNRSLPPLAVPSFASFATQTAKENPIVIRHIHEFKMSPSPTNEDSGCCRTSPSSCEGCEDTRGHSPDYGTLDSGVSGIYCGTLESGMSGVFRCLSPVIPSIVEECTTHHVTDILPALNGQRVASPGVMHHSHPAHTSCMHCCSHAAPDLSTGDSIPPRPHTVCSYTPPYQYRNSSSPTPSHTLPGSPPLSPLPTQSPLTLITSLHSNTDTETNTDKSTKPPRVSYAVSVGSGTATIITTTYTNPVVSSPQGRRSSAVFPRSSLPPESPTPHNSPRLPNSINATRSRASKASLSASLSEVPPASALDVPIAQSLLVGRSQSQENCTKPSEFMMDKERSHESYSTDASLGDKIDARNMAGNDVSECSSDVSEVSSRVSESSREKPYQIPPKARQISVESNKSNDVIPASTPSICKVSEESDKHNQLKEKNLTQVKGSPVQDKESVGVFKSKSPFSRASNDRLSLRMPLRQNLDPETSTPGRQQTSNNSIPFMRSTGIINTAVKASKHDKNSRNSSPAVGRKEVLDPISSNKMNHVKFREPVVSQVKSDVQPVPHYSPASPRERVSPPKLTSSNPPRTQVDNKSPKTAMSHVKTVPVIHQSGKSQAKEKPRNAPVKLISDTLFTRFVVSPEMENRGRRRFASTTDTDTDLDTLERRLTFGMYDAPLVSSESCTSVGPEDGDDDPSATEYCTDNDGVDFNPNQFKANINHTLDKNKNSEGTEAEAKDETDETSVTRTYSFFRRQSKLKKHRKAQQGREDVPHITGGVVKNRNKTAKHMVAETFSAMFTLCTP